MEAEQTILTRQLPKTGALVLDPVVERDDFAFHAGWWKGRTYDTNKTRFIISGEGLNRVTVDRATGLMWAADGNGVGCYGAAAVSWATAVGFIPAGGFAGFEDWRLPNIIELLSIVNYGKVSPVIDPAYFPNTKASNYWSSTTRFGTPDTAWYVVFTLGNAYTKPKTDSLYLRLVRGGL